MKSNRRNAVPPSRERPPSTWTLEELPPDIYRQLVAWAADVLRDMADKQQERRASPVPLRRRQRA